jgi:hypothetical protein
MDDEDYKISKIPDIKLFWDSAHDRSSSIWTSSTPFDYLKSIFMFEDFDTSTRILIVGIGTGSELEGHRSRGFTQVHGVDISEVAIQKLSHFNVFSWDQLQKI